MIETFIAVYLFVVGAAFGSFTLVLVDRMRSKRNWVTGRSACEHCKHKLAPVDLIPLASWVLQRGKCRYCKKSIGASYPLTELLVAGLFVSSYLWLPYSLSGVGIVLFIIWLSALILMSALLIFDIRWQLLPTNLIKPLVGLGIVHAIGWYFLSDKSLINHVGSTVAAIGVGAGVFGMLFVLSKGRWIGDGDVRFGVAIGLFTADPLLAWLVIFSASVFGMMYGLPMLVTSKKKTSLKIPFGPFLILGLVFTYLWGQQIVNWYLETFLFL